MIDLTAIVAATVTVAMLVMVWALILTEYRGM